jgi:hypothetical protein
MRNEALYDLLEDHVIEDAEIELRANRQQYLQLKNDILRAQSLLGQKLMQQISLDTVTTQGMGL